MSWITVDFDGTEVLWENKPGRVLYNNLGRLFINTWITSCKHKILKDGDSLKLTGKQMTWDDEPVELSQKVG
jgi:hypothetical protein